MSSNNYSDPAVLAHRHELQVHGRATAATMTATAVIFVVLRFWARTKSKAGLGWDDWLLFVALVSNFGSLALVLLLYQNGLGLPDTEIQHSELVAIIKILHIGAANYLFILALVKISILVMYWRFFPLPAVRIGAWILGILTVIWALLYTLLYIFQCMPVKSLWDIQVSGKCINLRGLYFGNATLNLLTDIMILFMPLFYIWTMKFNLKQRISLTVIFLLGCFAIVARIFHFVSMLNLNANNFSYTVSAPVYWSQIEICTSIMSACLPCMRPLLTSLLKLIGYKGSANPQSENVATLNTWRSSQTTVAPEIVEAGIWKGEIPRSHVVSIHEGEKGESSKDAVIEEV